MTTLGMVRRSLYAVKGSLTKPYSDIHRTLVKSTYTLVIVYHGYRMDLRCQPSSVCWDEADDMLIRSTYTLVILVSLPNGSTMSAILCVLG